MFSYRGFVQIPSGFLWKCVFVCVITCDCVCTVLNVLPDSAQPLMLYLIGKNCSTWNWLIPDFWLIRELIDLCSSLLFPSFCPLFFCKCNQSSLHMHCLLPLSLTFPSLFFSFNTQKPPLLFSIYSLSTLFEPQPPLPALLTLTWKTVTNKTPFWRPFRFLQSVETPGNLFALPAHKEASFSARSVLWLTAKLFKSSEVIFQIQKSDLNILSGRKDQVCLWLLYVLYLFSDFVPHKNGLLLLLYTQQHQMLHLLSFIKVEGIIQWKYYCIKTLQCKKIEI